MSKHNGVTLGHWNYRIMKWDDVLMIHEVFYDEHGNPQFYSEGGAVVVGDDEADLMEVMANLTSALQKPVLTAADFPEGRNIQ